MLNCHPLVQMHPKTSVSLLASLARENQPGDYAGGPGGMEVLVQWYHLAVTPALPPYSPSLRPCPTPAPASGVLEAVLKEVKTLEDLNQHTNIVRFFGG